MKKIFLVLCVLLSVSLVKAQQALPEFNDKPAYYDSASKSLKELEKSSYNAMAKAKGIFKAEAGYFLEGASSPVKVGKKNKLSFIVKVNPGADPSSVFDLARFEVRKDKRVYIAAKAKVGSSSTSVTKIEYDVKKIKDGYYYLVANNLEKGEYFFGGSEYMFAFSVE